MSLVLRPPGTRDLPARLADLGRARRAAAVAAELFRLLAGLLGAALLAGLLDAAVGLPPLPRAGLLVLLLAAAGVGWLRLVRPATREPVAPLAVALRLEAAFPRLNDALASATEFLLAGPDRMTRFQQVAHLRAENLADRVDLRRAVPAGRAWAGFWLVCVAAAAMAAVALVSPPRTVAAARRLLDPFGGHPWPTRTTVELLDAPALLAAGDPYPLRFRVAGRVPEAATVSVRVGSAATDEAVPVPDGGEVSRPLDPGRVARSFQVRVTAGDGDTGWVPVEVAPPPRLVPAGDRPSPQVRLQFPGYTLLPPTDLPDGTGLVEGVAGTRVSFRASADRPIVSALFRPQFDVAPFKLAAALAPLAADHPLAPPLAAEVAGGFTADIPVRCRGAELDAEFVPPLPGLYALRFADDRGLTGTRLFDFRVFPDPAPAAALARPVAGRDPLDLLPTARLPLGVAAEDRLFGVRWLAVEYRVGGPDAPFRRLVLADPEAAELLPAAVGGGLVGGPLRPPAVQADRTLSVAGFTRPDGSPPVDGDTITLRAAAADWDDRTALKGPGLSPEVDVRVRGRESLEAEFQKGLAGLRPELGRLREELRAAREKLQDGPKTDADRATAAAAVRAAKSKLDDPSAGLKGRADRMDTTRRANALPRTPTTDKVEAAAAAARRAAEQLDAAEQAATDKTVPPAEAADGVKAAETEVAKLLEKLEQWGGAGEVRGEARALKDQVARAGEQAEAAADPASRSRAADKLDQAGDQAAGLVGKAGRLAVERDAQAAAAKAAAKAAEQGGDAAAAAAAADRAAQAAAEADALRKAVREAGGQAVPDALRKAADELRGDRPGESAEARRAAEDRLAKMADPLAEAPDGADQLARRQKEAATAADKLAAAQDELRKKTKQAEATADPAGREQQLQKLAREQQKLREEAELLAEKLTRDKNAPAAAAAKAAADEMAAAGDKLRQGQSPQDGQQEAADKLDELKQKLDQKPPDAADALSREEREQAAEKIKALRDRQQAAVDEAARVTAAAGAAGRWDRPLLASLGDLEDREAGLGGEVKALAEKELADLPVFRKLAAQAADAITLAGKRAADRRDDAALADAPDPAADDRVLRPMRVAVRKLDQILLAVAPDPADKPKPDAAGGGGGGGGGGGEGGGAANGGGLPPLAQLKALRAMQAEVAEQTAAFAAAHPDPAKLSPDQKADLVTLEQAQKDVAELFAKLAAAFRPPAELP